MTPERLAKIREHAELWCRSCAVCYAALPELLAEYDRLALTARPDRDAAALEAMRLLRDVCSHETGVPSWVDSVLWCWANDAGASPYETFIRQAKALRAALAAQDRTGGSDGE